MNDFTNIAFTTPRAVQDVTGLDKTAIERLLLLADFTCTLNGVFNAAANQAHDVFKTVPSTSVARTVTLTTNGEDAGQRNPVHRLPADPRAGRLPRLPGAWVLANGAVPTWA